MAGLVDRADTVGSVGIPQGLIVDPETGAMAGAVRRGGELVSVDPEDYRLWTLLLTPLPFVAIAETAARRGWADPGAAVERLSGSNLLVTIGNAEETLNPDLARLRPLPLGVGIGNSGDSSGDFQLQNASLSLATPLSLDAIAIMFWWEFDGTSSLGDVIERVGGLLGEFPRDALEYAAARLTRDLMASRLLYLDGPRPV